MHYLYSLFTWAWGAALVHNATIYSEFLSGFTRTALMAKGEGGGWERQCQGKCPDKMKAGKQAELLEVT